MANSRYRHGDPYTSVEAAEAIEPFRTEVQRRVRKFYNAIGRTGSTDKEMTDYMARAYGGPETLRSSNYRSRRNELTKLGYICDSGRYRFYGESNRKHIVWVSSQHAPQHRP